MSAFTQSELKAMASACAEKVIRAPQDQAYFDEPYRHLIIDDFFDRRLADLCLQNFPALDDSSWEKADDPDIEVKFRTTWTSEFDIPEGLVDAVRILNSSIFLNAMAQRVGIPKIVP